MIKILCNPQLFDNWPYTYTIEHSIDIITTVVPRYQIPPPSRNRVTPNIRQKRPDIEAVHQKPVKVAGYRSITPISNHFDRILARPAIEVAG